MPITPQRKVPALSPLQAPRASADAFGSQVGQAIGQAGQAVSKVAGDVQQIQQRSDQYAAKNKYLDALEQTNQAVSEFQNRSGADAVNVTSEFEAQLSKIEADITKDMSANQHALFTQNWRPAAIGFRKSVSSHELREIKRSEVETDNKLLSFSRARYAESGDTQNLDEGFAAAASMTASSSPEVRQMSETETGAVFAQARFQHLVGRGDFDAADSYLTEQAEMNLLNEEQVDMAKTALSAAKKSNQMQLEKESAQRMNMGNARATEYMLENQGVAPLEFYEDLWESEGLARAARDKDLASFAKEAPAAEGGAEGVAATGSATDAILMADEFINRPGSVTIDKLQEAYFGLKDDDSLVGKAAKTTLGAALKAFTTDDSPAHLNVDLQLQAQAVKDFNTAIDKSGWLNRQEVFRGKGVEQDKKTGKVTSTNEATTAFYELMASWDNVKLQKSTELGRPLTGEEMGDLGGKFFSGVKSWRYREQFTGGGAATALKDLSATEALNRAPGETNAREQVNVELRQMIKEVRANQENKANANQAK